MPTSVSYTHLLSGLRESLLQLPLLQNLLVNSKTILLETLGANLQAPREVLQLLSQAIKPEPASVLREGGVIANGYDAELDELRALQTNHGDFLLQFEADSYTHLDEFEKWKIGNC